MIRRMAILMVILAAIFALTACQPEEEETSAAKPVITEERAEKILDIWREARNTYNLDLLDSIYTPESAIHDPGAERDICGVAELKQYYIRTHKAFPDVHFEIGEYRIAEDWLISFWTIEGTNTGSLGELPPTGKEVLVSGVAIDRIEEGMIAEEWVFLNSLDLYQQLGFELVPPQPESEEGN
ncbi:MAG: hypothetical protein GF310_06035 [candidate division Zixibacteria bacterium]|nr:hypothetical protein [candidate division Zixibacteria bacterium]